MQIQQYVQNSLFRFLFYTGLYMLAGFVVLVINLIYVDDFCRRIARLLYELISLISLLFWWPCYVYAEHMIIRFANDLFTVLTKDKHACQQREKFPMGLTIYFNTNSS